MSQIFAGIETPFINTATLKRVMSNRQKDNIFQGIFTRPNEACTEKFSEDTDAAEIQVIRVKPHDSVARELGADINGGFFNGEKPSQPATAAYGIKIITTIDDIVDIPTNMQGMINVDLAEATLSNLYGLVDRNVNAITMAAQLGKALSGAKTNIVTIPASPEKGAYKDALIDANAFLDEGNLDEGIDTYPRDQRAIIMRSSFNATLKKTGELILNSNYGQIMVKTGALDPDTKLESVLNFVGTVDDTPCYVASNPVWSLVEKYLGLTAGALNGVLALVVSAIGTGRALAFQDAIKTIDSPDGQGIRIQPKYRMGAECWDELSVVPIVANDFENPVSGAVKVLAPGSRTFTVTYNGNGNTGGTVPSAQSNLTYGQSITAATNSGSLAKTGSTFAGWNTRADGKGVSVAEGDTYRVNGNVTLYAVWRAD